MTSPAQQPVSVPVPGVELHRPERRNHYRALLGHLTGRGKTAAAARADLGQQVAAAVECASTPPAFARDDDGSLIVAVLRPWGVEWFRVTDQGHWPIGTGDLAGRTPEEDLARVHHYTVIPPRS